MTKLKLLIVIFALGVSFVTPLSLRAQQENPEETPEEAPEETIDSSTPQIVSPLDNPVMSVKIPGLTLRDASCDTEGCSIPWLPDYINGLYRYGIGIIGILAVIGLMLGGVLWLTSAGNEERVGDAKKWIGGSVLGVLVAVTSYSLLMLVNPALTKLSPLKVSSFQRIDLPQIIPPEELEPVDPNAPSTNIGFSQAKFKVPILYQNRFPDPFPSSGCGVVSLTMVLNFYGVNTSATDMGNATKSGSDWSPGNGGWQTGMPGFEKYLTKNGLKTKSVSAGASLESVLGLLQYGPVITSFKSVSDKCKCVYPRGSAHYIVITGYENGKISANDPNDNNHSRVMKTTQGWNNETIDTAQLDINIVKKCCLINAGAITAYK